MVFKTHIGNMNRALITPIYKQLLEAWSDMMGNKIPKPYTLSEIYHKLIFFNKHSRNNHNPSTISGKPPPVWAEEKLKNC